MRSRNKDIFDNLPDIIIDISTYKVSDISIIKNRIMILINDQQYLSSRLKNKLCFRRGCIICKEDIIVQDKSVCRNCLKEAKKRSRLELDSLSEEMSKKMKLD